MPPIACFPPVYHLIKFHSCATVHSAGRGAFSFPLRGKRLFWIEIIHAVEGGWSPNRILILFIYSFPFFFLNISKLSQNIYLLEFLSKKQDSLLYIYKSFVNNSVKILENPVRWKYRVFREWKDRGIAGKDVQRGKWSRGGIDWGKSGA